MDNFKEKREAFEKRIKVNIPDSEQRKIAKQAQFSSKNSSNTSANSNKGDAPDRQRSLTTGRGNER